MTRDWYHDYSQETGDEIECAVCRDTVHVVELLERTFETRHDSTNHALSADGSHEAVAVAI